MQHVAIVAQCMGVNLFTMNFSVRYISISFTFFLLFINFSFAQPVFLRPSPLGEGKGVRWADSVFNSLTPDQRIGQLFMVAAYSNEKADTVQISVFVFEHGLSYLTDFPQAAVMINKL